MAELPALDDSRTTGMSLPLSEQRPAAVRSQGFWKETLWKTYYTVRSKVASKSVEIDHTTQVWLLGTCYDVTNTTNELVKKTNRDKDGIPPHIQEFLSHAYSVIWMTYRVRFPPLPETTMTTDCGWGCMIRSGQMILANALNVHLLGKDWRLLHCSRDDLATHKKVLSWFREGGDGRTPFSLHKLIQVARRHGNQPGQWFGPAQVAVMIRDVLNASREQVVELHNFTIVLAHDCTVYRQDILDLMVKEEQERKEKGDDREQAVMLLIPMRLGVDRLNPIYVRNITFLLSLDQSLGVIGGRPKHSLYFIGYQDNDLLYLDPHIPQPAVTAENNDFDHKSYHCQAPHRLAATKMDPSCAFGIYCRNKEDFKQFCIEAERGNAPELQRISYPFFTIEETRLRQLQHPYARSHVSLDLTRTFPDAFQELIEVKDDSNIHSNVGDVVSNIVTIDDSPDNEDFVVISTTS